jgi:serine/tyrosine/threonine adenylyltransferase
MAAHTAPRLSFNDLPRTHVFTSKLPPDPSFPTPLDSHKAPRESLGPRLVKGALYTYVRPEPPKEPELLAVSPAALRDIGLGEEAGKTEEFRDVVSGTKILGWCEKTGEGIYPWAHCYGGFQFGSWAGQLGDGRAISLFETTNPTTHTRYEIQLKGAGKTPFSRFADGKAVLRSSIREFIVSEALHALSIPTTRALSLTLLPHSKVQRERLEPGAIVCRFAQTWLRIGTFDILRARGDRGLIRKLSTYVAKDVFGGWENLPAKAPSGQFETVDIRRGVPGKVVEGSLGEEENRFARLYREIVRRNAITVAAWQAYAFTNGVLNTDNTSLYGLSIDYGPFAFLDNFDPNYTPNHDDHMLRYSYRNQPTVIWWNLVRLGESLAELLGAGARVDEEDFIENGVREEDADELVKRAEGIIERAGEEYKAVFLAEYKRLMTARLGLRTYKDGDFQNLSSELLDIMSSLELDFNHFFRRLASVRLAELESEEGRKEAAGRFFHEEGPAGISEESARARIGNWLVAWRVRALEDWGEGKDGERETAMKAVNPKVSPFPLKPSPLN